MKTKAMTVILCSLLALGAGAAEDVRDVGKQTGIRIMLENPFKEAARVKNEAVQLQQDLKRFVSAYEAKKVSLEQLRNFYEKRVKSFCLYYHKLSEDEWAVFLDLPSGIHMRGGFLWDMRVKLNILTSIFMDEDQGDGYVWGNKSYTGPKEVVALKVFSDGMDDFLEWMEIFKDRMGGSLLASGAGAAEDVRDVGKQTGIRIMLENPVKKAARVKNEAVQLQQDLKRFVSAYEAKKVSLEQLRNFYEKRVKSFCLYYHKLSEDEWAVLLDLPSGFHVRGGFLWDMRVGLNDLTEIFMDEDQGDGYVWGNKSYTGPKEVVALKVFSDGMDDFLEWMEIFKDRMGGSLPASGAGAAEDVRDVGNQTGTRIMLGDTVKKAARVGKNPSLLQGAIIPTRGRRKWWR